MTNSNLIIVGRIRPDRENMASVLRAAFGQTSARFDGPPFPDYTHDPGVIIVFVSSKERFPSVLEECKKQKLPLVVVSSGIEIPTEGLNIPVVSAPNLALLILALFDVLPRLGKLAQAIGAKTSVVEAHQASKTSVAITASKIASMFGTPEEEIGHVRSNAVASALLGVPEEHLAGFAQHYVKIADAGVVEVSISTKITGRQAYAKGLELLITKMREQDLSPGLHHAHEIVFRE